MINQSNIAQKVQKNESNIGQKIHEISDLQFGDFINKNILDEEKNDGKYYSEI